MTESKIRRINLFAGPGAGKSTVAAYVYASLKSYGVAIELVREYVKIWAYEERPIGSFDQLYVFAKQLKAEDVLLRDDRTDYVITDSPVALTAWYAREYEFKGWVELMDLSDIFEEKFPSISIFLNRGDKTYHEHGRYQTYEEALDYDIKIKGHLKDFHIPFLEMSFDNIDGIASYVAAAIKVDRNENEEETG